MTLQKRVASTPPSRTPSVPSQERRQMTWEAAQGNLEAMVEVTGAMPQFDIPAGAGVKGFRTIAVQVRLAKMGVKVVGATPNTRRASAHRLEIARMFELAHTGDVERQALTWVSDLDHQDDGYGRVKTRHTVLMPLGGPFGLKNLKPWKQAYDAVTEALDWATARLHACSNDTQYGLLMILNLSDWRRESWKDHDSVVHPYLDADVMGIGYLELVELGEPDYEQLERGARMEYERDNSRNGDADGLTAGMYEE